MTLQLQVRNRTGAKIQLQNEFVRNANAENFYIHELPSLIRVICDNVILILRCVRDPSNANRQCEHWGKMISKRLMLCKCDVEKLVSSSVSMVKMLEQSLKFRSLL